VMFQ
jgi:transposase InsO family protein